MATDKNGDPQSHIGENLQLKTPSELINGAVGNFSIKIDNLKPNTAYENMYSIRWYNPGTQLFSEYVDVPRFKTLPIPKPVNTSPSKVTTEVFANRVDIKDSTTRNITDEEATLKAYRVSDGVVVGTSKTNTVSISNLTAETSYANQYGIFWENSSGESNRVKVSFTTLSDTTKSDTTTDNTTTE